MNPALKEYYSYNPETGIVITAVDVYSYNGALSKRKGERVGSRHKTYGHRYINHRGKRILEHRLAWFLYYGVVPKTIDHINGIADDNRLCNLRECTQAQNVYNRRIASNNTSGYKGVSFHKKARKYSAVVKINRKSIYQADFKIIEPCEPPSSPIQPRFKYVFD